MKHLSLYSATIFKANTHTLDFRLTAQLRTYLYAHIHNRYIYIPQERPTDTTLFSIFDVHV